MSTTTLLSHDEVSDVIAQQHKYLQQKVRDSIRFKLRHSILKDDLNDLLSEAIVNTLSRHYDGLIHFESEAKVIGYILFSCWCNYRTQSMKSSTVQWKKGRNAKDIHAQDDWEREGAQMLSFDTYYEIRTKVVSLNNLSEMDSLPALEYQEHRDETDQDLTDSYYTELYEKLFTYLEDCVADGEFRFDEVNIYKQYIFNQWTMKKLVEESDFNKTFVYDAVKKIKTHLRTVDWNIRPRE